MDLSAEDNLRLNVLLAQNLRAVRIDESKMTVFALTDRGEAKVPLNPNCKDEKYIKQVKAVLSTHVMGSPGGYPVFLKRWTRMGQARDESLAQLLMLGEEEAVVAAVHAAGLTDELAERAWWAMPTAENARRMLEKEAVVKGRTGPVLAEFLVEFLPFEEEQRAMIESVRLVLQPGLISEEEKKKLWKRARTKRSFYVGFLHSVPEDLPEDAVPHANYAQVSEQLKALVDAGNRYADMVVRAFSDRGQCFINTATIALKKPSDQEVVELLLDAIAAYFKTIRPERVTADDIDAITAEAQKLCKADEDILAVVEQLPELEAVIRAMIILSCLSVKLVNPIFARTDAIGTMMRKKIQPVTDPVFEQLAVLQAGH
ncbi:MAG: sulfur reduction protein DsrS [Gammaproteobacteria bacterium]|nr:sulfur reduction protein DsrS [Gammaproteobacteria bacterium]